MRLVSLSVVLIALGPMAFSAAFGPAAFAQGTVTESGGVTVLRGPGASPPTPPAPAAPPAQTVIQRETIYQPVYVDTPGYGYGYGYVGVGPTVGPGINPPRRAVPAAPAPQSTVPNGWPLVQGGRR